MAKRVRKPKKDGRLLFTKVGGGSFTMGNRMIKPGQQFYAYPEEIPEAFRDVVIQLEHSRPPKVMTVDFKLVPVPDTELFNIVDGNGKVMNEDPLEKEKAEEYLSKLE